MTEPHWSDTLEHCLRELLPADFPASVPVYICSRWETDARFDGANFFAYCGDVLDLKLRPLLARQGRWRGRGFGAVLFLHRFNHIDVGYRTLALLNAVLHEAAHFVSAPPSIIRHKPLEEWPAQLRTLAADVSDPDSTTAVFTSDKSAPPWADHEAGFIRAGLHVVHRCVTRGYKTSAEALSIAGEHYGLSPAAAYRDALGDELQKCIDIPIRNVLLGLEPPEAFLDLFRRDTQKHQPAEPVLDSAGEPAGSGFSSVAAGGG